MVFGLLGKSTGWPGGVLLRSDDSGNTWPVCGAMNTRANVFQASEALAVHHGYSIDISSMLTVTPVTPDATLSSLTEAQLYAHGNIAAYGADGRWEIIAFKTVTDNAGTYTLKDFLRGLYGTEQNTALHAAGDLIVMLDTATVGFFGLPVNAIGSPRPYRAVTQGAAIDSSADEIDTYDANNLKPLAPVDLRGSRNPSTLDWTVEFTRRTRWPVEVFSGATVPLGETSELYEVEFWDATYATLKRTVSGLTTPSCPYSSANQVADFGVTQSTLYPKARQVSSVAGRGHALSQSITRILPTVSDYRVVGLHFNGSNGATSTTEEKGRTVSFFGNAQISTTRYKWVSSLLLDGAGDYISIPHHVDLNLTSGDWIVRGWIWVVSLTAGTMDIINKDGVSGSSYSQYTMGINSAGKLAGFVGNGNGVSPTGTAYTGTTTVTTGAWHYVEMTNVAGVVYLWLDGALEASAAKATMYDGGKALLFGYQTGQPASSYFNGNLEDFEIVKGFGGHTSPYSVPTAPF